MKKILFISTLYYPYHVGGAEILTQILAEKLAEKKEKYSVSVLTYDRHNSIAKFNGVKIIRHNFSNNTSNTSPIINDNNFEAIVLLKKAIGKINDIFLSKHKKEFYNSFLKKYDLVITSGNCSKMGIRDLWRCSAYLNIPLVHIIRDSFLLYPIKQHPSKIPLLDNLFRYLMLKDTNKVKYFVSPSIRILQNHFKYGLKQENYYVIPNTVDDQLCNELQFKEKQNNVLYVGRIDHNKGCHTLIKAFLKLAEQHKDYKLLLIGKKVDVEIPEHKQIEVLGHKPIKDVYQYMSKSKLVVLPSEWEEAFGRVIVEAVFNHTISIGSDSGGIPGIFENDNRFIFQKGNVEELYGKMAYYMSLDEKHYDFFLNYLLNKFKKYRLKEHINIWDNYINQILEREKAGK